MALSGQGERPTSRPGGEIDGYRQLALLELDGDGVQTSEEPEEGRLHHIPGMVDE